MDATDRRIAEVLDLMIALDRATEGWQGRSMNEDQAMKSFNE
jgi:hypothetical protein